MIDLSSISGWLSQLVDAPLWVFLLAKITIALAIAWLVHGVLARANPRWRVLLWRTVVPGLMILVPLSFVPSFVQLEVAPDETNFAESDEAGQITASGADSRYSEAAILIPMEMENPYAWTSTEVEPARETTIVPPPPVLDSPALASVGKVGELKRSSGTLSWVLLSVWAVGVVALLARMEFGRLSLSATMRRSHEVPREIRELCARIAKQLGLRQKVEVRMTRVSTSPCVVGIRQPVLLLPSSVCVDSVRKDLAAVLAHELSHVRSRDLTWNATLRLLSALLWFHPLIWQIRASHAFACELVADALSADFVGDRRSYGRILARVALLIHAPPPLASVPMARSSQIRRRLEVLKGRAFTGPLRRTRVAVLTICGLFAMALFGGLHFVYAQQDDEKTPQQSAQQDPAKIDENQNANRQMEVRILDSAGAPIPNATLNVRIRNDDLDHKPDSTGSVVVKLPAEEPSLFVLKAKAPGHVWMRATWRNREEKDPLPREFTFRLEKGTKIGGVVVDDEGKPIEGVKLSFSASGIKSSKRAQQSIYAHIVKTNAEGRWICDIMPDDLTQLAMTYVHSDYVSDHNSRVVQNGLFPKLRDMTYRRVMQTGVPVQGQVTDPDGIPIEGAVLAMGRDPTGAFNPHPKPRTNKDGRYRFANQAMGSTDITVVAKGFAPHTQRIDVRPNISPLNLQLKAGHTIRMRVLDKAGNPLPSVTILPVAWRGNEALLGLYEFGIPHVTGKDGRLEWTWAPGDAVDYDIFTRDHMSIRDRTMTPREEEYVFTLRKELDISGRVLDAETKEPIKSFRLIPGVEPLSGGVSWQRSWQQFGKDGLYRYRRTIPSKGYQLRIESPGYKPGESRVFRSDEETVTFDFEMVRGKGPMGVVLSAAGKPVAGAEAILCKPQNGPYFRNGAGYDPERVETAKTGADGRFEFAFQTEPFAVVVVAQEGYANVSQANLERSREIKIQPWAQVEGKLKIGSEPGANQKMTLRFRRQTVRGQPHMTFHYEATTDQDGNFAFTRVPPNMECFVARQVDLGRSGRTITHRIELATQPGHTKKLTIGGTGRPVIGRFVSEREIKEWNFGFPSLRPADHAAGLPGLGQSYGFRINADGSFRIEDVPSGSYVLSLSVYQPVLRGQYWRRGELIGRLSHSFEIKRMPDGRSDQPIDLGKLELP